MSEDGGHIATHPKEEVKGEEEVAEPSAPGLAEASSDVGEGGRRSPRQSQTTSKCQTTSKSPSPSKTPTTSGSPATSKSSVDSSDRRQLSENLRREVSQHEQRLEATSQRVQHAAQHLSALVQVAETLLRVIEVEKKKGEDHITLKERQEEEKASGSAGEKDEGPWASANRGRRAGKRTCSDVVTISLEHYRDFLTSTESLAEGILLLQAEGGLGDIARELRGAPMEEDLARWRRVIALLVKYDDHVRRAIDCFDRQAGQTKAEEEQ